MSFSKYRIIRSVAVKYRNINDPHSPMYGAHFRLSDARLTKTGQILAAAPNAVSHVWCKL